FSPASFASKNVQIGYDRHPARPKRIPTTPAKVLSMHTAVTTHSFPPFALPVPGVHGVAFRSASLVNNALEQAANGRVRQRAGIIAFGVRQHVVLAVRLVQWNFRLLLELADFQRALGPLVQKFHQFLVDFIDAASPIIQVHGTTPPAFLLSIIPSEGPIVFIGPQSRNLNASASARTGVDRVSFMAQPRAATSRGEQLLGAIERTRRARRQRQLRILPFGFLK